MVNIYQLSDHESNPLSLCNFYKLLICTGECLIDKAYRLPLPSSLVILVSLLIQHFTLAEVMVFESALHIQLRDSSAKF